MGWDGGKGIKKKLVPTPDSCLARDESQLTRCAIIVPETSTLVRRGMIYGAALFFLFFVPSICIDGKSLAASTYAPCAIIMVRVGGMDTAGEEI